MFTKFSSNAAAFKYVCAQLWWLFVLTEHLVMLGRVAIISAPARRGPPSFPLHDAPRPTMSCTLHSTALVAHTARTPRLHSLIHPFLLSSIPSFLHSCFLCKTLATSIGARHRAGRGAAIAPTLPEWVIDARETLHYRAEEARASLLLFGCVLALY